MFALQTLEDAGRELELVEQPVKAHDLAGLRYVTGAPHAGDGRRKCSARARWWGTHPHARGRYRQHQLMKTGGISNAVKIADICGLAASTA